MLERMPENPVRVVQAINRQRGCPYAATVATEMGTGSVDAMTPTERKQEYYFLLDGVLELVIENTRHLRARFPYGLVECGPDGKLTSSLETTKERVRPYMAAGDFAGATYWAHNAIHRTIDIATELWLADTDVKSPEYQRINSLVDDPRKAAYGNVAIQKRVSSAANQTVLISCSTQQMTAHLFPHAEGRDFEPPDMMAAHARNIKFAMPLTQFHLLETRPIREVLGSEALPGGDMEVYTKPEFFVYADGALHPAGMRLAEAMKDYTGTFPDDRIGCPGARYIPEIWQWTGEASQELAMPALLPEGV